MDRPITPRNNPPPSVAGLAAMGLVISAGAMVMLPSPARYGLVAAAVVLVVLGALNTRRTRRRST